MRFDGVYLPWYAPWPITTAIHWLATTLTIERDKAILFDVSENPETIAFAAVFCWIVAACVPLLKSAAAAAPVAPIDRAAGDRGVFGRFLLAWFAIAAMIFTLFPTILIGGFVITHFGLKL
jgi:hypothetical protein